jgi:hypothetical protein
VFNKDIEHFFKTNFLYDCEIINDKYFIGTYDVMFGKRMRGGYLLDDWCTFDVCCGTDKALLEKVKAIYEKKVIKNMKEDKEPSYGLRGMSLIKPIFNDKEYMKWLLEVAKEVGEVDED